MNEYTGFKRFVNLQSIVHGLQLLFCHGNGKSGKSVLYGMFALSCFLMTPAPLAADNSQFDVLLRMAAVAAPSPASSVVAYSDSELKALLGHMDSVAPSSDFFLEVWVSDVGKLNSGITGFFVDINFDNGIVVANSLSHSPGPFTFLAGGAINNAAGLVSNFGGNDSSLSGVASEPTWARVGFIHMTTIGSGIAHIGSGLGIGGVGVFGRIPPESAEIDFEALSLVVPEPHSIVVLSLALGSLSLLSPTSQSRRAKRGNSRLARRHNS